MKRDRLILGAWACLVFGLLVRAIAIGLVGSELRPGFVVTPRRIDVNRANVAELSVLPGIGRSRAQAIVLARVRSGPFRCLEDLGRVDGFGPGTLGALRDHVTFGER